MRNYASLIFGCGCGSGDGENGGFSFEYGSNIHGFSFYISHFNVAMPTCNSIQNVSAAAYKTMTSQILV